MDQDYKKVRLGIVGGGPAGMFLYKKLIENGSPHFAIDIFDKKTQLGSGMPYSSDGATKEHITNVSANEIPTIVTTIKEWMQTVSPQMLNAFGIQLEKFSDYKVLPRLLFGEYLSAQFELLFKQGREKGIKTTLHLDSRVSDVTDHPELNEVHIHDAEGKIHAFDCVIICTGHNWPKKNEGKITGYFDSPYPPSKLAIKINHPVAIRGSSLTAIDAIRTLARNNGKFSEKPDGMLEFKLNKDSKGFRLDMHSRSGLLPAVRFHLEDSHLQGASLLTPDEITAHRKANNGFLSLDYIFEKDFKKQFEYKDPDFYQKISNMSIEEFVDHMMELRERLDPFVLLQAEYQQAEKSIKRQESIHWKEMLAVLSFALNYPAKYLSAEDMMRLQKVLLPLISIVIAFVPQTSCKELLALHDAGLLDLIAVGENSEVEISDTNGIHNSYVDENGNEKSVAYKTFIDCVGQPHLSYDEFPFKGLVDAKSVSPAKLKFRSVEAATAALGKGNQSVFRDEDQEYYLQVSGITINDHFQVIDHFGAYNERIYIMAVPYIGGYNPDYSGLDFCEAASVHISAKILETYSS